MTTLADRFRQCAELVGSGDKLALLANIPRRTLEYYLSGQSEPKVERLVSIAKAAGVDLNWLASGEGKRLAAPTSSPDQQVALVPLYDVRVGDGHPDWLDGARVITYLPFSRKSLEGQGLIPEKLAAINVDGDSNEPTLSNGDTVLIDVSTNQLQGDGFYVISLAGLLCAKRLQRRIDGGLSVLSANPAYPSMIIQSDQKGAFQVMGRVVWVGGWMI